MSNSSVSPSAIIWKRLKKNIPAVIGLFIICLATLISVFCYLFIPDNTPHANEMNLAMSTLPPGSKMKVLQMPVNNATEKPSFIESVFSGTPSKMKIIPLDTLWINNDSVCYREYTGDPEIKFHLVKVHVLKAISGTDDFELKDGIGKWNNSTGEAVTIKLSDAPSIILEQHVATKKFVLGTDRFGRDLFSRILAGTRVSMSVGLIAVVISLIIGIALGSLAGFFRGKIDDVIMWLINVVWSIPTLLLVIAITLALGKGFAQVFIAVGLTMWVEVARVVRGQIFSIREMEFVEAGRALGFSNARIILRHIIPNILSPVVVIAASNFASAILLEAGLSFLGMGAQPPTPSWGMMIKENYGYIIVDAAYLAVYPGLAIMIMVLAFTWLGNGLRDAIDAKEGMGSRV